MEPVGTRDRYPLKAQVLRERAHAAAKNTGKMDAAALVLVDNDRRRIDVYERAFLYRFKQADDVVIAQAHAAVRHRRADQVLPAGAVDIDVALIRINARALIDPLLEAFEPQDAGQDQIISGQTVVPVFARILAVPENTARRRACSELLLDPMDTERRLERVLPIAVAETGRGAVVSLDDRVVLADEERLCLDGYYEITFSRVGQMLL